MNRPEVDHSSTLPTLINCSSKKNTWYINLNVNIGLMVNVKLVNYQLLINSGSMANFIMCMYPNIVSYLLL